MLFGVDIRQAFDGFLFCGFFLSGGFVGFAQLVV